MRVPFWDTGRGDSACEDTFPDKAKAALDAALWRNKKKAALLRGLECQASWNEARLNKNQTAKNSCHNGRQVEAWKPGPATNPPTAPFR